jgi:hypothetical protein
MLINNIQALNVDFSLEKKFKSLNLNRILKQSSINRFN